MFILHHVPLPFPGKFPVEQSISRISERIQKPSVLNGCALYIYSSKCNKNLNLRKASFVKTPKEIHSSQKSRKVPNLSEVCSAMVNFEASTNPNKRERETEQFHRPGTRKDCLNTDNLSGFLHGQHLTILIHMSIKILYSNNEQIIT